MPLPPWQPGPHFAVFHEGAVFACSHGVTDERGIPYAPALQGNATWQSGLPFPISRYGTDVSITLPSPASGYTTSNPHYRGCIEPTNVA